MKKFLFIILIFSFCSGAFSACRSAEANEPQANPPIPEHPPADVVQICDEALTFKTLDIEESNPILSIGGPSLVIANGWREAAILKGHISPHKVNRLQPVDYGESFLVGAFRGMRGAIGPKTEIKRIVRQNHQIMVEAEEENFNGFELQAVTSPYHVVQIDKNCQWNQEIDFLFSIDGQQVFTQTHFIPNRRSWDTIDKGETQPDWMMEAPNLMLITEQEEIPTLGNLISAKAISGLQNLNYEQSYAVLVFRGQQPSSGYGIEIEDISRQEYRVVIHAETAEPIEDVDVPSEPVSPYHLILIDRFYEEGDELDFVLSVNDSEVLTRTVTMGQNPPTPTPIPLPTITPTPTPVAVTLMIDKYSVEPEGKVDVTVHGSDFDNIVAGMVRIIYDPSVLRVSSCEVSAESKFDLRICNPDYEKNLILFGFISALGVTGAMNLAEITFESIGQSDKDSSLELQAEIYNNLDNFVPTNLIDGRIAISNPTISDTSGEGMIDSVDNTDTYAFSNMRRIYLPFVER